ncbi:MAG: UDP-N-acetylmuramate dehydrogenase [Firmicutes bacterium]|nr:UDP-N-acetylmuramate dehydrogenase [Bacillota bacterium]
MNGWRAKAETALSGLKLTRDLPMSKFTTYKIGGPLDLLVEPSNLEELQRTLSFCQEEQIPWVILGLGSNLLVRDKGIRGIGIKLAGEYAVWEATGTQATAGAGVALADLAKQTAGLGLSGLEFACGIPGSVGGAIFMNAGAYDGEMAQVVTEVQAYIPNQGLSLFSPPELQFGYRHSRFQQEPGIILKATLQLKACDREASKAKIRELTCKRESSQPLDLPSAGSVFRRPEGYFVGPLITEAGLRGYSIGGAQVSLKHSGFIVNTGTATAQDVLDLIAHIQQTVKAKFGVDLTPEYRILGEE